jgi:ribosomal RNA-processing protein 1
MWMADKPAPQQELAEGLAGFTLLLAPADGLLFLDAFYSTMAREWTGIDRLRMDKYYYLLNQMLRSAFELLRNGGWHRDRVAEFSRILTERVFTPSQTGTVGLCLQVVDHWVAELSAGGCAERAAMTQLLEPLLLLLRDTEHKVVAKRLISNLFEKLQEQPADVLNCNWSRLAEDCLALASSTARVGQMNRSALYDLRARVSASPAEDLAKAEPVEPRAKKRRAGVEGVDNSSADAALVPVQESAAETLSHPQPAAAEAVSEAAVATNDVLGYFVTASGTPLAPSEASLQRAHDLLSPPVAENPPRFVTGSGKALPVVKCFVVVDVVVLFAECKRGGRSDATA